MAKQTQILGEASRLVPDVNNYLECMDACKACAHLNKKGFWREFATCMETKMGMPWKVIQKNCVCGKITQADSPLADSQ